MEFLNRPPRGWLSGLPDKTPRECGPAQHHQPADTWGLGPDGIEMGVRWKLKLDWRDLVTQRHSLVTRDPCYEVVP